MKADKVLLGGSFFRGKNLNQDIDFIAVKDNVIVGMGKEAALPQYLGEDTEVKTYTKEQLILPGFYDSHGHILSGGMAAKYPDFGDCKTEEETAMAVKEYADQHPEEEWIFGFNWYQVYWGQEKPPTKATLDHYCPDRPVMITDAEGHAVWTNSKAMEYCGITKDTPDPLHGKIHRDEKGEPTGYFSEMAIGCIAKHAYNLPDELEKKFIRDYMEIAKALGIVATNDMLPYYGNDMGKPSVFSQMSKEGELTMRFHAAPNLFGDLEEVKKWSETYNDGMFQVALLKAFIDGVPTTYTSLMMEPFADNPSTCGSTLSDLDELKVQVLRAQQKGMSVRIHCCGDGAVHYALDCYEEALEKFGDTGSRHAVEHFETTIPEDIKRTARIGVIASMQPEHLAITDCFKDNPYLSRYNKRQQRYAWPIQSLIDAGATVAFGTDYPVVTNDPFLTLYRAVTRVYNDGEPLGGWNPEQKVSMEDALHCYTLNGYYGVHRETELGTLEVGKLADIIVLDQNLLKIETEKIRDTKVLLTMVDGKIVYEKR